MAADLELPKKILCHSHWTVDGTKMSKSKGNVLDPNQLIDQYTVDGIRYFLLREAVPHSDGNFSNQKMANYLNAELSNTLGNLLSRLTSNKLNSYQGIPEVQFDSNSVYLSDLAKSLIDTLDKLPKIVSKHYEEFNFYLGIDAIMESLRATNDYMTKEQPWILKKVDVERLNYVLILCLESLRISGILLQPIVPNISEQVLTKLGVPCDSRAWKDAETFSWEESKTGDKIRMFSKEKLVLFPKI